MAQRGVQRGVQEGTDCTSRGVVCRLALAFSFRQVPSGVLRWTGALLGRVPGIAVAGDHVVSPPLVRGDGLLALGIVRCHTPSSPLCTVHTQQASPFVKSACTFDTGLVRHAIGSESW